MEVGRKVMTKISLLYVRFQELVMMIFIIGAVDLVLYYDLLVMSLTFVEFSFPIFIILFGYGLVKFLLTRKKSAEERME
ncbi:hypothetical protein JI667_14480 [Bacillus sp. NTK074B]|uniref:hypothetical protein n=1 Tax=Bacillus sp. NTK074B TaxID=2802174 RepID=UPI001A8E1EC8|nr:hypothetical protein [Bacillus sp. NTK074B]